MTNERAERLLTSLGFQCEEEPHWITEGQVPDFFCHGKINLWVEVKTLQAPEEFERQGDAHVELRKRLGDINCTSDGGCVVAWVSLPLEGQDAKTAVGLVSRGIRRDADTDFVAMVPDDPIYNRFVSFAVSVGDGHTVKIMSCASESGKYGLPFSVQPESYFQQTVLRSSDEDERVVCLGDLWTGSDTFRIALEVTRGPEALHLLTTSITGAARELRNAYRLRAAVEEANAQFKNACRFKKAPCLLLVYQDDLFVAEDLIVASALFGNMVYVAPRSDWGAGEVQLGADGAWNSSKHRTMSALCYIRNNSGRVTVYNPWAELQVPRGLFDGCEVVLTPAGEIVISDSGRSSDETA